jgi:broad specificity phosphatase PhoE
LDARLSEVDFGRAEGCTFTELAARWPEHAAALLRRDAVDWPEGETAVAFTERVRAVWHDLEADPRELVVVAHGGTLGLWLDELRCEPRALMPGSVVRLMSEPQWRLTAAWAPDQ